MLSSMNGKYGGVSVKYASLIVSCNTIEPPYILLCYKKAILALLQRGSFSIEFILDMRLKKLLL